MRAVVLLIEGWRYDGAYAPSYGILYCGTSDEVGSLLRLLRCILGTPGNHISCIWLLRGIGCAASMDRLRRVIGRGYGTPGTEDEHSRWFMGSCSFEVQCTALLSTFTPWRSEFRHFLAPSYLATYNGNGTCCLYNAAIQPL